MVMIIPISILNFDKRREISSHHHSLAIIFIIMHAVTDFPMADRSTYLSVGVAWLGLLKDRYTTYTRNGPGWLWSTVSPPSRSFRQPDCPKQRAGTAEPFTVFWKKTLYTKDKGNKHKTKNNAELSIIWRSLLALDHGALDEWWRYGFTGSVDHNHFFPPVFVTSVPKQSVEPSEMGTVSVTNFVNAGFIPCQNTVHDLIAMLEFGTSCHLWSCGQTIF